MKIIYIFIMLFFSVASANAKDWKALWITSGSCQSATNSWICYHKTVELPEPDGSPVYADIAVFLAGWTGIFGRLISLGGLPLVWYRWYCRPTR